MTRPTDCLTPDCNGKLPDFLREKLSPPPFRERGAKLRTRMVGWRCRHCGKPVYVVERKK